MTRTVGTHPAWKHMLVATAQRPTSRKLRYRLAQPGLWCSPSTLWDGGVPRITRFIAGCKMLVYIGPFW